MILRRRNYESTSSNTSISARRRRQFSILALRRKRHLRATTIVVRIIILRLHSHPFILWHLIRIVRAPLYLYFGLLISIVAMRRLARPLAPDAVRAVLAARPIDAGASARLSIFLTRSRVRHARSCEQTARRRGAHDLQFESDLSLPLANERQSDTRRAKEREPRNGENELNQSFYPRGK